MYDVAVKHMTEILACSHQSKTTQELFLGDFLQVVEVTLYLIFKFLMFRTWLFVLNVSELALTWFFFILEIFLRVIYVDAELDSI
jgi:hypothetical protein